MNDQKLPFGSFFYTDSYRFPSERRKAGYLCFMAKPFSFGKAEKLKSRKSIEALFAEGEAFTRFPIRVVYRLLPAHEGAVLAGVSASKKYFKRAVDRNRIKRLLREAYRLQKTELKTLAEEKGLEVQVFFLFVGKDLPTFADTKASMLLCLQQLHKKCLSFERPA